MATGGYARSRPIVLSTPDAPPGKSAVRGALYGSDGERSWMVRTNELIGGGQKKSRCPACSSEVLYAGTLGENSRAYRAGWMDGRYGEIKSMAHNDRLAEWQEWRDRLDYYRGHRAGRKARPEEDERLPKAS